MTKCIKFASLERFQKFLQVSDPETDEVHNLLDFSITNLPKNLYIFVDDKSMSKSGFRKCKNNARIFQKALATFNFLWGFGQRKEVVVWF